MLDDFGVFEIQVVGLCRVIPKVIKLDRLVIATGNPTGAYHAFALQYQKLLAEEGIELEIVRTAGSIENLRRLRSGAGDVQLAFVQGGTASPEMAEDLQSLASLYVEPLWVFYRGDKPIDQLTQMRGKRLAIGPEGGWSHAARLLIGRFLGRIRAGVARKGPL